MGPELTGPNPLLPPLLHAVLCPLCVKAPSPPCSHPQGPSTLLAASSALGSHPWSCFFSEQVIRPSRRNYDTRAYWAAGPLQQEPALQRMTTLSKSQQLRRRGWDFMFRSGSHMTGDARCFPQQLSLDF